jgi:predicted nucleic acid-binding protein
VHPVTSAVVDEALRGVADHGLGFWDAQVWAVARLHQIEIAIGPDPRPGSLDGMRWLGPFDEGVDVETL